MSETLLSLSPTAHVYWDGLAAGEFQFQICGGCGLVRHPPASACGKCGSREWSIFKSARKGTVLSWVIPRRPQLPAPPAASGMTVVLVELEKRVRLLGQMAPDEPQPNIGDAVMGEVGRHGDKLIPLFRRIANAAS